MAAQAGETTAPPRWHVQTLGAFKVTYGSQTASFRTQKTASLFAQLAYYAGRPVSKDALCDTLWPDSPRSAARQSLRTALSSLRSGLVLKDDTLSSDSNTVELSPHGVTVDANEFRAAVAAARRATDDPARLAALSSAVALYQGPFLAGFAEDWVLPQALDLEESFVLAVSDLVGLMIGGAQDIEAIETASRAVALCPTREETHVALIKALTGAGRSSAALAQFERLERMLDDEWGEAPSAAAIAALETPLSRSRPGTGRDTGEAPDVLAPLEQRVPSETGGFYGRDEDVAEIARLAAPGNGTILTLTGLGGSGKTRLAKAVAEALDAPYHGRVWFTSLVGIEDSTHVAGAVFAQVKPAAVVGPDPFSDVAKAIGQEPALIVLDNIEQLLPGVTQVVRSLVAAMPQVSIVATSRWQLDLPGESVWPVGPLALPHTYKDVAALRACPSVQLLAERGQAVRPGFEVSPLNARGVYELSHKLGGIPLAIELAASKLSTKSPVQVLASISQTIDLATEKTTVPERHRSLRGVIEWNHAQLTSEEQESFAKLAVCHGGWLADLASALLDGDADEQVMAMVKASLVTWAETGDEVRFDMLEPVREFADEELARRAQLRRAATAGLCQFFHALCCPIPDPPDRDRWLKRLDSEQANLLAVIDAGAKGAIAPEAAWDIVDAVLLLIQHRGRVAVWLEPIARLIDATSDKLSPARSAAAHGAVARVYYGVRDIERVYHHVTAAIAKADESGDDKLRGSTRLLVATPGSLLGHFAAARATVEEAIAILEPEGDPAELSQAYLHLGWLIYDGGDAAGAVDVFQKALDQALTSGNSMKVGSAQVGLATAVGEADCETAMALFEAAMNDSYAPDMPERRAHALFYRSWVEYRHNRLEEALAHTEQFANIYNSSGFRLGQTPLSIAGIVLAALGRHEDAALFWGRAADSRRRYHMQMFPILVPHYEKELAATRSALGAAGLEQALAWGAEASDDELVTRVFGAPSHAAVRI